MKVLIDPKQSKNAIVTIAIGSSYLEEWESFSLENWKLYCNKHSLGLIVFDCNLIDVDNKFWKKPNWQKLLIGSILRESDIDVENICFLDSDILINPFSPNIFDEYDNTTIGVVSQVFDLPYPGEISNINRRIAFLRNKYYSNNYPLDSSLFMSPKQIFEYHGLKSFDNYACTGVFLFNLKNHSDMMHEWFFKYEKDIDTLTGGGEEPHLNFEIQSFNKITWLNYKFQALWNYEMAWKYPFLYQNLENKEYIARKCVESSLFTNYFLHFAGSWHESSMWKDRLIFSSSVSNEFKEFNDYMKVEVTGNPTGMNKPDRNC